MINLTIHQIYWDFSGHGGNCPEEWNELSKRLEERNPEFKYRLWGKVECSELIETHFPDYFPIYQQCLDIIKVDFARLVILYVHGGIYCDMDIYCFSSFGPLCKLSEDIHTLLFTDGIYNTITVSNAFLASVPQGPFIRKLIDQSLAQLKSSVQYHKFGLRRSRKTRNMFIMNCLGPFWLTSQVEVINPISIKKVSRDWISDYSGHVHEGILIFPPETILGYHPSNVGRIFGRHLIHGTWK